MFKKYIISIGQSFRCSSVVRSKINMSEEVIVQVNEGKLKGKKCFTDKKIQYFHFESVPFAKPPVGELRFKAPQPVEPWEGVRDATAIANSAPQFDKATGIVVGDEDCLYLKISTPELSKDQTKLKPVMFFVHGGGFVFGSIAEEGGDYLIEKDVIYVATQYRLGIFGFLCLDIEEAQGNMGLKDQVQALRWVKENISKFGGDPNNVTIFGVSAGGVSVEYLTLSPMAKGLFHKAIAQSGSSLNPWGNNRNNEVVIKTLIQNMQRPFNDNRELHKTLMQIPSGDLAKLGMSVMVNRPQYKGGIYFAFVPTIEKPLEGCEAFLTESTYTLLKRGEFTKVPYLSGVCNREGLLMYLSNEDALKRLLEEHKFVEHLPFALTDPQRSELADKFKTVYLETAKITGLSDSPGVDFFSDIDILAGAWIASRLISKYNSSTYFYEFCYDGGYNYFKAKFNWKMPGAAHADDTGYVLARSFILKSGTSEDNRMREQFVQMFVNFAKFGNPTPEKSEILPIIWEPINENTKKYLQIDKQLSLKENLEAKRLSLYEELYEKHWN